MELLYTFYHLVYRANCFILCIILASLGIVWAMIVQYWAVKSKKITFVCEMFLLCICIALIIYATIYDRNNTSDVALYLRPFHTFIAAKIQSELYRSTFMNMVLFYPLGLTLGCLFRKKSWRTFLLTICVVVLFSTCIECYQFVARLGEGDIDDVIFNTLGAIIGYGVAISGKPILHLILSVYGKLKSKIKI